MYLSDNKNKYDAVLQSEVPVSVVLFWDIIG